MAKRINSSTTSKFEGGCVERYLRLCAEGGSIPEFCLQERICRATFDAWCEKYPLMMHAKLKGRTWAEGWWMLQARQNLVTETIVENKNSVSTKFDSGLYKFIVGGRFGHTADKDAHDRLTKLEELLYKNVNTAIHTSAYTEEGECENEQGRPG